MTSYSDVQVVHKLSLATVPGFAYRDKVLQMWWNMDAVGIVFCVALGCLSLLLPLHDTAALTTQRTDPSPAASLLVCALSRFLCVALSGVVGQHVGVPAATLHSIWQSAYHPVRVNASYCEEV